MVQKLVDFYNYLKNINKTLGKLTQQSKRPLQGNGMAAISKMIEQKYPKSLTV